MWLPIENPWGSAAPFLAGRPAQIEALGMANGNDSGVRFLTRLERASACIKGVQSGTLTRLHASGGFLARSSPIPLLLGDSRKPDYLLL